MAKKPKPMPSGKGGKGGAHDMLPHAIKKGGKKGY